MQGFSPTMTYDHNEQARVGGSPLLQQQVKSQKILQYRNNCIVAKSQHIRVSRVYFQRSQDGNKGENVARSGS